MLGKLLKHEFRQTGKMFAPMFCGVIGLVLVTKIFWVINDSLGYGKNVNATLYSAVEAFTNIFSGLMFLALFTIIVATCIIIICRFYKNALGDEGYLMFTLPASTSAHIFAKAIVGFVWTIVSVLISVGSFVLFAWEDLKDMPNIAEIFSEVAKHTGNGIYLTIVLAVVLFVVAMFASLLRLYMIMSIGSIWSANRLAATIGTFFIYQIATQFIWAIVGGVFGVIVFSQENLMYSFNNLMANANPVAVVNCFFGIGITVMVIFSGVYFAVTHWILDKHLNLA